MSANTPIDFDITVIGGGLVGACCAVLLSIQPELADLKIALLDSNPPAAPPPDDHVDLRVSAISRASEKIFAAAGAWSLIPSAHRAAYTDMVVWDALGKAEESASLHFSAAQTSEPNLGYIIENRRLLWALYETPQMRTRIAMLRGTVAQLEFGTHCAGIELTDRRRLHTRLVIAADGANSASRKLAGIETRGWDYPQKAIVAHVRTEKHHRHTAWQRFLPSGPLAFLPLGDGRSSIVWSTTVAQADQLLALDAEQFSRVLTQTSDGVMGTLQLDSERAAFALRLAHANDYCRERLVLIGDAAHSIHPLAGQGVNLGFTDCAALAQVLVDARNPAGPRTDFAERRVLRRYERWRKSENLLAMGLIDGLSRLFGASHPAIGQARRWGLGLLERSPAAKRILISRALGLAGEPARVVDSSY